MAAKPATVATVAYGAAGAGGTGGSLVYGAPAGAPSPSPASTTVSSPTATSAPATQTTAKSQTNTPAASGNYTVSYGGYGTGSIAPPMGGSLDPSAMYGGSRTYASAAGATVFETITLGGSNSGSSSSTSSSIAGASGSSSASNQGSAGTGGAEEEAGTSSTGTTKSTGTDPYANVQEIVVTASKPSILDCLTDKDVALAMTSTALDAFGTIPGVNELTGNLQIGAGVLSAGISAGVGNTTNAGLAGAGLGVAAGDKALGEGALKLVPGLGNIVSAVSAGYDVFGEGGVIDSLNKCTNPVAKK